MKIKLTGVRSIYRYGRSVAVCTPRDEQGNMLLSETSVAEVLADAKRNGHEIVNAQEVLECVVSQLGFAA